MSTTGKKSSPARNKISKSNESIRQTQFMKLPQETHKEVIQYVSPNDYQTVIKTNKYLATLMKTMNDNKMREIEKKHLTETSLSRFIHLLIEYTRWKQVKLNMMYIYKFIKKTPFEKDAVGVVQALLQNKKISKIRIDVPDICQYMAGVLKNKFADFLIDNISFFLHHVSPSHLKEILNLIGDRKKRETVAVFFLYESTIHNRLKMFGTHRQALHFLQLFVDKHDRDFPSLHNRIRNATVSPNTKKSR